MTEYVQGATSPEQPAKVPFYKRPWFAAVVAGVVGLVIGAVAAGGSDASEDAEAAPATTVTVTAEAEDQPPVDEPAGEPTSEAPEEEPTSEAPPASTNPVFGDTFAYENGLSVTVSAPVEFTPSASAAGAVEGTANLMFAVTLANGTAENFDPSIFIASLQSGSAEASQVFDVDPQLGGGPSTTLLPGREATFNIGFSGITNPADLVLEATPSFDYDAVIFTL